MKKSIKYPMSSESKEDECEVCRHTYYDNNVFEKYRCKVCDKIVHKNCYSPTHRSKEHFKCDQCRLQPEKTPKCYLCRVDNGVLKNTSEGKWVHVLCALFSFQLRLKSFRTLEFRQANRIEDKQKNFCSICGKKSREVIHCLKQDCNNYAHVGCVLGHRFKQNNEYLLSYTHLDRHNHGIIPNLSRHKDNFIFWTFVKPKKLKQIMCEAHNDDPTFIHCFCGKSKFKHGEKKAVAPKKEGEESSPEELIPQICCEKCKRWAHTECSKVSDTSEEWICDGCKEGDIYKKSVYLPEQVSLLCDIERNGEIDQKDLPFLDSVIIKYSEQLIKICCQTKSASRIDRHFMKKTLERLARQLKNAKDFDENVVKRKKEQVFLILDYLVNRKMRKQIRTQRESYKQFLSECKEKCYYGITHGSSDIVKWLLIDKIRSFGEEEVEEKIKEQAVANIESKTQLEPMVKLQPKIQKTKGEINLQTVLKAKAPILSLQRLNPHELSQNVFIYIQELQKNQLAHESMAKLKSHRHPKLIEVLFNSKLTRNEIQKIFQNFRRIAIMLHLNKIKEKNVVEILSQSERDLENLSETKTDQLNTIFVNNLKKGKIVFNYEVQESLLDKALKKIANKVTPKKKKIIQRELISKMVYLAAVQDKIFNSYKEIYFSIRKQKLLRCIYEPLGEQAQEIVSELRQYNLNNSEFDFTAEEQKEVNLFLCRVRFYMKIVTIIKDVGKQVVCDLEEDEKEIDVDTLCMIGGVNNLFKIGTQTIKKWPFQNKMANQSAFMAFSDDFVHKKKIQPSQKEFLNEFCQKILDKVAKKYREYPGQMTPNILNRMCNLIRNPKSERHFQQFFVKRLKAFNEWKEEIQKLKESQFLNTRAGCEKIKSLIPEKLHQIGNLMLNLNKQTKQLKLLFTWANFSVRVMDWLDKKRPDMFNEIFLYMDVVQKISYPQNDLRNKLERIHKQAIIFKPNILRFQNRSYDNQQLWQEIERIAAKPKYEEGAAFLKELQACKIDFSLEAVRLLDNLIGFETIPENLAVWVNQQNNSIVDLQRMRKLIVESPFIFSNIMEYEVLYTRIYFLKCQQPKEDLTEKQIKRMLMYGGAGIPHLLQKLQPQLKAKHILEIAKKELLQTKPRSEFLIPYEKKILDELRKDKETEKEINAYVERCEYLLKKLQKLKNERNYWCQFVDIMAQFAKLPFDMKQTLEEIKDLKTMFENRSRDAKEILNTTSAFKINEDQALELKQRYLRGGVRSKEMQTFCAIVEDSQRMLVVSKEFKINNYKQFCELVQKHVEVEKNHFVLQLRYNYFEYMFECFMGGKISMKKESTIMLKEVGFLIAAFSQKDGQAKTVNKLILQCKEVTNKILENEKKREEESNRGPRTVRMREAVEAERGGSKTYMQQQKNILVKEEEQYLQYIQHIDEDRPGYVSERKATVPSYGSRSSPYKQEFRQPPTVMQVITEPPQEY